MTDTEKAAAFERWFRDTSVAKLGAYSEWLNDPNRPENDNLRDAFMAGASLNLLERADVQKLINVVLHYPTQFRHFAWDTRNPNPHQYNQVGLAQTPEEREKHAQWHEREAAEWEAILDKLKEMAR